MNLSYIAAANYSGICSNCVANFSLTNGNLLTVQISISYHQQISTCSTHPRPSRLSSQNCTRGGPCRDPTYRLQRLLNLHAQRARLDGDDIRRRVRIMRNRAAALAAEDAVHGFAAAALAGPALRWAGDLEFGLGHDGYEGWRERGEAVS